MEKGSEVITPRNIILTADAAQVEKFFGLPQGKYLTSVTAHISGTTIDNGETCFIFLGLRSSTLGETVAQLKQGVLRSGKDAFTWNGRIRIPPTTDLQFFGSLSDDAAANMKVSISGVIEP